MPGKKKPRRTDAWTELLRTPAFAKPEGRGQKKLPPRTKLAHVLLGLGLHPPIVLGTRTFPGQRKDEGNRIRSTIANNALFASSAFGVTMGVAHQDWTPRAKAAFNLEDPPSPYEVATYTLGQYGLGTPAPFSSATRAKKPHATRRFFQGIAGRAPRLHTSAFMWWLIGVGDEAIEEVIPGWEQVRADYIRVLMETSSFAMWALGADLTPIVRSPRHARALLTEDVEFRAERKEIFSSTYVQTLLRLGKRARPVSRVLPTLSPVYATMAEKEQTEFLLPEIWQGELERVRGNMWWNVVGLKMYPNRKERIQHRDGGFTFQLEGRRVL